MLVLVFGLRGRRAARFVATVLALGFLVTAVRAEEPASAGELAPRGQRHDGFFFHLGLGVGWHSDIIDSSAVGDASLSGLGVPGELLLGGTVARGLVIGGGTHGGWIPNPSLHIDGASRAGGPNVLTLSVIGPFFDYYFDEREGLHVRALVGFSTLSADGSSFDENPVGAAVAFALGHSAWIGEEWSAGGLVRLVLGSLSYDGQGIDESHLVIAPGVLATITYH